MKFIDKLNRNEVYIIAEMSANHCGSFERAIEIIHAAKESGADCIKIQTYTPDTMTINCDNKYFKINSGIWKGKNLYGLYKRAYTPWEWQKELQQEAKNIGIDFLSTPFDKTSVDFLEDIGIEFYKISSFELVDLPLIEYIASKGKPIIMSTGMGKLGEIEDAINVIRKQSNNNISLLKCSSAYPAISDNMNLNTMINMKNTFNVTVGLSDHSMGSVGALVAVAMGANIIEKHFCLSRENENPDSSFSMEPKEFAKMVKDIKMVQKAKGIVKYGPTTDEVSNLNFRRSIFAVKDIKKGEILTEENIRIIRPAYGLKPKYFPIILGKKAMCNITKGSPIKFDLICENND